MIHNEKINEVTVASPVTHAGVELTGSVLDQYQIDILDIQTQIDRCAKQPVCVFVEGGKVFVFE